MRKDYTKKLSNVIEINESQIQDHLGEIVRGTVEETINAMLDAEADALCNAARYERSEARKDTRAGYYKRDLHTKAGEVKLKVPKLRRMLPSLLLHNSSSIVERNYEHNNIIYYLVLILGTTSNRSSKLP